MGRNGEESVEKKCTSNLDTGLIRGNNPDDYSTQQPSGFRACSTKPDPNYWCIFSNGL